MNESSSSKILNSYSIESRNHQFCILEFLQQIIFYSFSVTLLCFFHWQSAVWQPYPQRLLGDKEQPSHILLPVQSINVSFFFVLANCYIFIWLLLQQLQQLVWWAFFFYANREYDLKSTNRTLNHKIDWKRCTCFRTRNNKYFRLVVPFYTVNF